MLARVGAIAEYSKHMLVSSQDCPNPKVHKQDLNSNLAAVLSCVFYSAIAPKFQLQDLHVIKSLCMLPCIDFYISAHFFVYLFCFVFIFSQNSMLDCADPYDCLCTTVTITKNASSKVKIRLTQIETNMPVDNMYLLVCQYAFASSRQSCMSV